MIGALIGLYTSTAMSHNISYAMTRNMGRGISFGKSSALNHAQNSTMYKIAAAQQSYYKKMLNKNIERSFNIFA